MKVLVATHETQGHDPDDYSDTVDGELVAALASTCSSPECGCERGFSGLASSRSTTTAMVVDLPHIGERELTQLIIDSLLRSGRPDTAGDDDHLRKIDASIEAIMEVCDEFAVGTVIGRSGDFVWERPRRSMAA